MFEIFILFLFIIDIYSLFMENYLFFFKFYLNDWRSTEGTREP